MLVAAVRCGAEPQCCYLAFACAESWDGGGGRKAMEGAPDRHWALGASEPLPVLEKKRVMKQLINRSQRFPRTNLLHSRFGTLVPA